MRIYVKSFDLYIKKEYFKMLKTIGILETRKLKIAENRNPDSDKDFIMFPDCNIVITQSELKTLNENWEMKQNGNQIVVIEDSERPEKPKPKKPTTKNKSDFTMEVKGKNKKGQIKIGPKKDK